MKKLLLLALLTLPLISKAQLVQTPEYPWRVTVSDLSYDASQNLTGCPVTVYYRSSILTGNSLVANVQSNPQTLTLDLVAKANSTVVFNGTTYTYGQAFAIMNAIFAQERANELAHPTPDVLPPPAVTNNAVVLPVVTTNNASITTNNSP